MADSKLTALTELTTPADEDLLYIVDDPSGTPVSKKITRANLLGGAGAPTDASYVVEAANGTLSAEVVLGTTVITTAAYASRQAAAIAGRLFLPSNSFYLERDTGAAWAPWGPIFRLTQPVSGDFSWVNQGGASVSTTNGGIFLSAPASASDSLRCRVKSAPATPYTITALMLPLLYSENYHHCGLLFRESGTGELATMHFAVGLDAALKIQVTKWDSPTAWNADYVGQVAWPKNGPLWLRIADDGANRISSISADGQNFLTIHSVGRTDFLTADQVGFFANSNNSGHAAGVTLLSWAQA